MPKKTATSKSTHQKGKKGGASVVSPEVIGAVTGMAIGAVTGAMLAKKNPRHNLSTVKDKALDNVGNVMDSSMISDVEEKANEIYEKAKNMKTAIHKSTK